MEEATHKSFISSSHSTKNKRKLLFLISWNKEIHLFVEVELKIYYNSKYIDAEETDVSRNQTSSEWNE